MTTARPLPRGYVGAAVPAFYDFEIVIAIAGAVLIQALFFMLLALAANRAHIEEVKAPVKTPQAIAVKPVLDETKLLKLGGKQKVKYKLPDMWKKQPPIRRQKAASAPSPHAEDDPNKIPKSPLTDGSAPEPDAEIAKEVDDLQPDASDPDAEAQVEGEGSPDGVEEGTETDPTKAMAVSLYRRKLLAWFNARWSPPGSGAPCAELKQMSASMAVSVGGDRRITGYSIASPSGNATFDAKVKATMDGIVGQQLPPPPPLYPDILDSTQSVRFTGSRAPCEAAPSHSEPAPAEAPAEEASPNDTPDPAAPEPEAPPAAPPDVPHEGTGE